MKNRQLKMGHEGRLGDLTPSLPLDLLRFAALRTFYCTSLPKINLAQQCRRFTLHFSSVSLLLCVLAYGCAASNPRRHHDPALAAVSWMAGSWVRSSPRSHNEEYWSAPAGGTMVGVNRTIAGGKTVFYEYLRIEVQEDGIYYLASPKGRYPPTPFKLTSSTANEAVFENPEHDFPTRIIYRRRGNKLYARIEGTQRGEQRSSDWMWQRASIK